MMGMDGKGSQGKGRWRKGGNGPLKEVKGIKREGRIRVVECIKDEYDGDKLFRFMRDAT